MLLWVIGSSASQASALPLCISHLPWHLRLYPIRPSVFPKGYCQSLLTGLLRQFQLSQREAFFFLFFVSDSSCLSRRFFIKRQIVQDTYYNEFVFVICFNQKWKRKTWYFVGKKKINSPGDYTRRRRTVFVPASLCVTLGWYFGWCCPLKSVYALEASAVTSFVEHPQRLNSGLLLAR